MSDRMFADQITECLAELSPVTREDLQIASDGVVRAVKQERAQSYFSPDQALELLVKVHNRYKRDPAGGWSAK